MKAKMSNDSDSDIYDYLGFNKEKIVNEVENYTGNKRQFFIGSKRQKEKAVKPKTKAYTKMQGEALSDFFASIGSKPV